MSVYTALIRDDKVHPHGESEAYIAKQKSLGIKHPQPARISFILLPLPSSSSSFQIGLLKENLYFFCSSGADILVTFF